jgi:regulatory protein
VAKIIALQLNKPQKRVTVLLDDASSFVIDKLVAEDAGLKKGLELSAKQLKSLMEADLYRRCLEAALRFLAYRPRSEKEVKQSLRRRGFGDGITSKVLAKLGEQNLLNDKAFAQFWTHSRLSSNPKSRRLIKYELLGKGISREAAEQATSDIDDAANAYKAGLKKARLMSSLDYSEFRRRIASYLKWRGFSYDVVDSVSERLWQEK